MNKYRFAKYLQSIGIKPHVSTFIDDTTITMGYGKLSDMGDWQFPLPDLGRWIGEKLIKFESESVIIDW